MLFNSMEFIIFFPIVVLIYFIIPQKIRNIWLLIVSYYFYMCWSVKYVLLLFFSTVITYTSGLFLEWTKYTEWKEIWKKRCKKAIVILCFGSNLMILFYFKYINFALNLITRIFAIWRIQLNVPVIDVLLPVGISFYVFQALSYIMDVYRNEICAEKNIFQYALFVSFFPQLVAGPIERSRNLLKQLKKPGYFDYWSVRNGLLLMLWGYFLKLVISDRCAVLVNQVYGNVDSYQGFQLILANILFAFQIYCDFMGYSVIAKGAAEVLGYRLMDNFAQPYLAGSIKEFWHRWHISLSTWFRDYLYIPLGGSRKSLLVKYRNLMITFLVSGLWHGASLSFVIWGGIHGFYQIVEELITPGFALLCKKAKIKTEVFSWRFLGIIKNFILVDMAWVFFRANSVKTAVIILRKSFQFSNLGLLLNNGLFQLGLNERNIMILLIALIVLLVVSLMKEQGIDVKLWLMRQNAFFRYSIYWLGVVLIVFSMDITGCEFIYFQF